MYALATTKCIKETMYNNGIHSYNP